MEYTRKLSSPGYHESDNLVMQSLPAGGLILEEPSDLVFDGSGEVFDESLTVGDSEEGVKIRPPPAKKQALSEDQEHGLTLGTEGQLDTEKPYCLSDQNGTREDDSVTPQPHTEQVPEDEVEENVVSVENDIEKPQLYGEGGAVSVEETELYGEGGAVSVEETELYGEGGAVSVEETELETGVEDQISVEQTKLETGVEDQISVEQTELETGVEDQISVEQTELETGVEDQISVEQTELETGVEDQISVEQTELETGVDDQISVEQTELETGVEDQISVEQTELETGVEDQISVEQTELETGVDDQISVEQTELETGVEDQISVEQTELETGVDDQISVEQTELETGVEDQISVEQTELETGVDDQISVEQTELETGVDDQISVEQTELETGVEDQISVEQTELETGVDDQISVEQTELETGVDDQISVEQTELETGVEDQISVEQTELETGVDDQISVEQTELETGVEDQETELDAEGDVVPPHLDGKEEDVTSVEKTDEVFDSELDTEKRKVEKEQVSFGNDGTSETEREETVEPVTDEMEGLAVADADIEPPTPVSGSVGMVQVEKERVLENGVERGEGRPVDDSARDDDETANVGGSESHSEGAVIGEREGEGKEREGGREKEGEAGKDGVPEAQLTQRHTHTSERFTGDSPADRDPAVVVQPGLPVGLLGLLRRLCGWAQPRNRRIFVFGTFGLLALASVVFLGANLFGDSETQAKRSASATL